MLKTCLLPLALATSGAAFAATQAVTLSVPDMTCAVCPLLVKQSLLRVEGVVGVEPDLARRQATVTFDADEASPAELLDAARKAGYTSSIVPVQPLRTGD